MEDTVGGVVSWDVQIARDDGNVARGYEDHDGTIPYRAATLSTRIHSLSLSLSHPSSQYSPLSRCDVTLLEKYVYKRIVRRGRSIPPHIVYTHCPIVGKGGRVETLRCSDQIGSTESLEGGSIGSTAPTANPREPRNIRRPQFLVVPSPQTERRYIFRGNADRRSRPGYFA